jgi:kynurenine formamidase
MGLDTPSLDFGQSRDFKTHQVLMGANRPGFENLANLDKLPARGIYVVALPMKIARGSGGPLRIIAAIR